jgi:alpha-L-rhamnosidase
MPSFNRRQFLQRIGLGAGALALTGNVPRSWAQPENATPAGPSGTLRALDLRTDTRVNPLGLEPHHLRFGWRLRDGDFQAAWQAQAASDPKLLTAGRPDLWDSGKREAEETTHIAYEGTPLASDQAAW